MIQRKRKTTDNSQSPSHLVGDADTSTAATSAFQQSQQYGADIPVSTNDAASGPSVVGKTTPSGRAQRACVYCYNSKMRCLREPDGGGSCKRCLGAGITCTVRARKPYRIGLPRGHQKAGMTLEDVPGRQIASSELDERNQITASVQDVSDSFSLPDLPFPAIQPLQNVPSVTPSMLAVNDVSSLPIRHTYGEVASYTLEGPLDLVNSGLDAMSWPSSSVPGFNMAQSVNGQSTSTSQVTFLSPQTQQPLGSSMSTTQRRPTLQQGSLLTTPLETLATVGAERSATDEQAGIAELRNLLNPSNPHVRVESVKPGPRGVMGEQVNDSNYFTPHYNPANLEYLEAKDPVSQYMLSVREANVLFDLYWMHLQPLVAILDPHLHPMATVRRTSTFLFTAVLTAAAKFASDYDGIAHRLDEHARHLAADTILHGVSSLEVVQGFCILCPWLDSGPHVSMDVTSTFLAIAYDRFKRLKPPEYEGDSLDQRRKRSYERTYLTLYNYDRGSALVSGAPLGFSLPETSAVTEVGVWAQAQDAIEEDNCLAALVTLRQTVPGMLQAIVQKTSDRQGEHQDWMQTWLRNPAQISTVTRDFLAAWKQDWLKGKPIDTYLSIVGHHTILSVLVTTLKEHMGRETEAAMLVQAFMASMQTLQVFISASLDGLRYLVNNTFVMIAYAAAFAMHALTYWQDAGSPIEASMYSMLSETANRLISLGRSPAHRYGRSSIYGQRLRKRLQGQMETRRQSRQPSRQVSPLPESGRSIPNGHEGASQPEQHVPPAAGLDIATMTFAQMDELLSSNLWRPLNDTDPLDATLFDPGLGFLNLEC